MFYTSIKPNSNTGILRNDEREIQVSEWWSGDGVYVNLETPPKDGIMSTRLSFSIGIEDITDLSALLVSMDLLDLSEIEDRSDEINRAINNRNQHKLRF